MLTSTRLQPVDSAVRPAEVQPPVTAPSAVREPLLRTLLGATLRRERLDQRRTLRDVAAAARVSLGYLSEIERGQKEASSELLAAICSSLQLRVLDVLRTAVDEATERTDIDGLSGGLHQRATVEALPLRAAAGAPLAAPAVVNRAA